VVAEDAPRDMALLTFSFSQKECVGGGPVSLYIDPRLLDKFQMMGKLVGVGFPSEDWLLLRTVSGLVDQSDWRRKYPQKLKEYSFDRVLGSHGSVPSMIITDSEPVPGDSGSPLLDAKTLSVVGMIVQRVKGHGYAVPAKSLSDFAGSHLGAIAVESLDSASTNQFAVEVSQGSGLPGQQDWVRISERDLLEPGDYRIRVVGSRFDYGGEIQVRNRMRHRVVALPRSGTSLEQLLEILY